MSLLCYTTDSKAVVLIVVVRGVDIRTIQVQVVRVVSIVRRTRPVVAVAALIVGTAAVPVAGQDERTLVLDKLDTGGLGNAYGYLPARQSNKYRKEMTIFVNRLAPKGKALVGLWVCRPMAFGLVAFCARPPDRRVISASFGLFCPGAIVFYRMTAVWI